MPVNICYRHQFFAVAIAGVVVVIVGALLVLSVTIAIVVVVVRESIAGWKFVATAGIVVTIAFVVVACCSKDYKRRKIIINFMGGILLLSRNVKGFERNWSHL